jgi:response regulator RpfG family c-di-GMP phosphodiesterase
MDTDKILRGKRVLIVDDEQDILDLLVQLLSACMVDAASSFEEAKRLLETENYDIAVLIPALMLTAHALSEETLRKSAEDGASYYVPKDEIGKIDVFVGDVIEAREKKKNPWVRWYERLGSFFDKKFSGPNWREQQREFSMLNQLFLVPNAR